MNGIQIKSYLFPDNAKVSLNSISQVEEIRRFSLAVNSQYGLYENLIQKIQATYGSLLPKREEIKTFWIDEESELVGFSSDNELSYAIDVQTAVRMSKPAYPYENGQSNFLFKVYIARKPLIQQEQSEAPRSPDLSQCDPSKIHFGVVCDGCNGPVVGIRFKCGTCPDFDLCELCEKKGIHKEHTFNRIEKPRCARGGFFGRHGYHHRGHHHHRPSPGPAVSPNQFQQFIKNMMPQIVNNIPVVSNPEQLSNFGEFMKGFLDPFGIDVSYYVDNNSTSPKSEEKSEQKTQTESEEKEKQTPMEETLVETETETSQMKRSESLMDESVNLSVPTIHATNLNEKSTSAPVEPLITYADSNYEAASNALKEVIEKNSKIEEAVIVTSESNKALEESIEESFNLVDIEKELKIIRAIEQLKSMGYRDDGGWLTRLVSAKDGNINMVLDAIAPSIGPKN